MAEDFESAFKDVLCWNGQWMKHERAARRNVHIKVSDHFAARYQELSEQVLLRALAVAFRK